MLPLRLLSAVGGDWAAAPQQQHCKAPYVLHGSGTDASVGQDNGRQGDLLASGQFFAF
jgi:hypothetical protein